MMPNSEGHQELSDQEMGDLAQLVATSLASGKSQIEVAKQLVDSGWEEQPAHEFVGQIAIAMLEADDPQHAGSGGGGGMSWLIWIGLLVGINVLSYFFEWPFWIY
jgi:hypothetical protein